MNVLAVIISDLHLSLLRPACRADDDWLAVQARYLKQVTDYVGEWDVPVLCCGDVFDRWNPNPELIGFAIRNLPPKMISIPGQHDLPYHQIDQMHRSGYGVLKEAGSIIDASGGSPIRLDDFFLMGFGWEEEPISYDMIKRKIAIVHRYLWTDGASYPGADVKKKVGKSTELLEKNYARVFFGDNHQPFTYKNIVNCGTFIRRKSDEIPLQPSMYVLMEDLTVRRKKLDTSADKFHDRPEEREEAAFNMSDFINSLEKLGEHGLDFRAAVKHHLETEDIDLKTKEIILKAIG